LYIIRHNFNLIPLFTNYFQPQVKCIEKIRIGSKIKKRYDKPKTPYQRIIECDKIDPETKEKLKKMYEELDIVKIKEKIVRLADKLFKIVGKKGGG